MPPTHEIYSKKMCEDLKGQPKFYMITNGVRLLAIHTDEDLPLAWQSGAIRTKLRAFQAAANVVMYVTDKGMVQPRAGSIWPSEPKFATDSDDSSTIPPPPQDTWPPRPVRPGASFRVVHP